MLLPALVFDGQAVLVAVLQGPEAEPAEHVLGRLAWDSVN